MNTVRGNPDIVDWSSGKGIMSMIIESVYEHQPARLLPLLISDGFLAASLERWIDGACTRGTNPSVSRKRCWTHQMDTIAQTLFAAP